MILLKKAVDLTKELKTISDAGKSIGFVPTMGALHEGHLQLVQQCRAGSDITVVSIFVNPTQFNDPSDFARYPVTIEQDIRLLEEAGCDLLFLPSVEEIYPNGTAQLPRFDLGRLENIWEGKYRPGHFQGVCQVMSRLLELVMPAKLLMGRKDYQQCMVIRRLIGLKQWPIQLVIAATVREPSGLAMSSRNRRLDEQAKEKATAIFQALRFLAENLQPGPQQEMLTRATSMLNNAGFEKIDYLALADAATLEPVDDWNGQQQLVALAAAFINEVRLIDNMPLG
ncbi:MAG: pantoate--beta-alanine ligase [Chitinophagaceae bacterium]|nr:pantoate--beta-alanine ligase [Chitinophagaceae bacterium]